MLVMLATETIDCIGLLIKRGIYVLNFVGNYFQHFLPDDESTENHYQVNSMEDG